MINISSDFQSISIEDSLFEEYESVDPPLKAILKLSKINVFVGENNSGKSRLLRKIFSNENPKFICNEKVNLTALQNSFERLCLEFQKLRSTEFEIMFDEEFKELQSIEIPRYLENMNEFDFILKPLRKIANTNYDEAGSRKTIAYKIQELARRYNKEILSILKNLSSIPVKYKSIYIPTLRGIRPIQHPFDNSTDNYSLRTINDYFKAQIKSENLYTGLRLYKDLQNYSHGSQKEQELLSNFENFLSVTFFKGEAVKLTPRVHTDITYVRIGNVEKPIFDLGDGIQSIIILTYPLFFNQGRALKVFIEEPEMHLHPGFQRIYIETLLLPQFSSFQYFLTSHSNHILDMTLETQSISIYTLQKKLSNNSESFKITNVENTDLNILSLLGVRNSSVFLTNCTIWVEGITDRIYVRKYIDLLQKEKKLQQFKEDIHYSFVEYGGSNIDHWSFVDSGDKLHTNIVVERLCGKIFVIADSDGASATHNVAKFEKHKQMANNLKERFYKLRSLEIENLLLPSVIRSVVADLEKMNFMDVYWNNNSFETYKENKIGKIIEQNMVGIKKKYANATGSILNKVEFAKKSVLFLNSIQDMSEEAIELAERLYMFIAGNNLKESFA